MTAVAQACHNVRESFRSSLVSLELEVTQTQMLLSIMRRHCKLGVEHGRADTSPERRWQIRAEIQSLRALRDDLIAEWRKGVKKLIEVGKLEPIDGLSFFVVTDAFFVLTRI